MNSTFKVVFNKARGALMVVNEVTSSVQAKGTKTVVATAVAAMIAGVAGTAYAEDIVDNKDATGTIKTIFGETVEFGNITGNTVTAAKNYLQGGIVKASYNAKVTATKSEVANNTISQSANYLQGGIFNNSSAAELQVTNSKIVNNTIKQDSGYYMQGGLILNDEGTLTVTNSIVSSNNVSTSVGRIQGGIVNNDDGKATVTGSSFSKNILSAETSFVQGGVLYNTSGYGNVKASMTVSSSTFEGNSSTAGSYLQGGIINNYNGSELTVDQKSVFNQNTATATGSYQVQGGVILNDGSTATIDGASFTNNIAIAKGTTVGNSISDGVFGGVIMNSGNATITIKNSSFVGNQATSGTRIFGGVIGNRAGSNQTLNMTISDTEFKQNSANAPEVFGGVILNGFVKTNEGQANNHNLTLSGVTITGNTITSKNEDAAAVYNRGNLTVEGTNVIENNLTNGVARDIYNEGSITIAGNLTVGTLDSRSGTITVGERSALTLKGDTSLVSTGFTNKGTVTLDGKLTVDADGRDFGGDVILTDGSDVTVKSSGRNIKSFTGKNASLTLEAATLTRADGTNVGEVSGLYIATEGHTDYQPTIDVKNLSLINHLPDDQLGHGIYITAPGTSLDIQAETVSIDSTKSELVGGKHEGEGISAHHTTDVAITATKSLTIDAGRYGIRVNGASSDNETKVALNGAKGSEISVKSHGNAIFVHGGGTLVVDNETGTNYFEVLATEEGTVSAGQANALATGGYAGDTDKTKQNTVVIKGQTNTFVGDVALRNVNDSVRIEGNTSVTGDISVASGSLTVSAPDAITVSGSLTGNGSITHESGELNIGGKVDGFTGTFTPGGGSLAVTDAGGYFGGNVVVTGGTLDVTHLTVEAATLDKTVVSADGRLSAMSAQIFKTGLGDSGKAETPEALKVGSLFTAGNGGTLVLNDARYNLAYTKAITGIDKLVMTGDLITESGISNKESLDNLDVVNGNTTLTEVTADTGSKNLQIGGAQSSS